MDLSALCGLQADSVRAPVGGELNPGTGERPLRFLRGLASLELSIVRRRRRKKTLEDARNTNQEDSRTTTTFCLFLPFLFLPGAARFRRGSFAVGGGCQIPFLGVPKRIEGWGPTFPPLGGLPSESVGGGQTFPPLSAENAGSSGFLVVVLCRAVVIRCLSIIGRGACRTP